jgi:DNA-binding ferritin-like protein
MPPCLRGPARPDSYIPDCCKVVISGVATSWTDDEIKQSTKADYAQRLIKKNGDSRTPTTVVILGFKNGLETKPPAAVRLGHTQIKTRPFIPLPIRCFRCQRFNHTAAKCRSTEVRCVRCGGGHDFKDCDRKDHPKCANCGGPHSTAAPICPTFLREKAAKKIERLEGIPYYKATRAAKKQQQENQQSDVQQPARVKPGPARSAWTKTDSGDAPEQPAQPIPKQRRQVITVQPPVVDMDTQTTTTLPDNDNNQQIEQKIEEVTGRLRQKFDSIVIDIQKRMDDIAEKLEKKMDEFITETNNRLEELSAKHEAESNDVQREVGDIKRGHMAIMETIQNSKRRIKEVEDANDADIDYMMNRTQEIADNNLHLLKTTRLALQMAKRQVKSGTTDHEQLKVTLDDIDRRTTSTAAAIAVYQEHDEKRKKAEGEKNDRTDS